MINYCTERLGICSILAKTCVPILFLNIQNMFLFALNVFLCAEKLFVQVTWAPFSLIWFYMK